ncbi:Crn1 protein [Phytophthora nicotianae]|nr:Crn1 protein [Phytophthora nicotianae]KUF93951.1 Crn1 protein [Phytophthora nicotianae]KUF98156.1 Dolichyl-phosphate beta-glucosyltransferase [Phytophthora nicotianae]
MRASWKLSKPNLFGPGVSLGEDVVHVLVVVPEGAVGSASEASTLARMSAKLDDLHNQAIGKRKYVHSEVTSTQGRQLLNDLDIRVEFVRTVPFAAGEGSSVGPFEWKRVIIENGEEVVLTEEQQRKLYLEYVERNIGDVLMKKQLSVIGVERGTNILTVEVPGREIELAGRTDLLILSDLVKMRPSEVRYLPGVKMLIEVKRDVKPSNDFQALSELIALDLIAGDPVMALLTDLKGEWLFFWVAEKINNSARICKAAINEPSEAFEVIKALLAQPPTAGTATEITLPCFQLPVKRLKLREALPATGEGGGAIRESIERYYDIASMLGPDIEMARSVARQVTRSIPTLSYFS